MPRFPLGVCFKLTKDILAKYSSFEWFWLVFKKQNIFANIFICMGFFLNQRMEKQIYMSNYIPEETFIPSSVADPDPVVGIRS